MKKLFIPLFSLLVCGCNHAFSGSKDLSDRLIPMGSYDVGNGDHVNAFYDNRHQVVCYVLDNKDTHSISCLRDLGVWNLPKSEFDENHQ